MEPFKIALNFYDTSIRTKISDNHIDKIVDDISKEFLNKAGSGFSQNLSFFLFIESYERISDNSYTFGGSLIGPDSFSWKADVMCEESDGEIKARWDELPIDAIKNFYGLSKPVKIKIWGIPFSIIWTDFWESHLPDFYLTIHLDSDKTSEFKKEVDSFFEKKRIAYFDTQIAPENIVVIQLSFDIKGKILRRIKTIFRYLKKLHKKYEIDKIVVGF